MPETHTRETFTRHVARKEAERRGITVDWNAAVPEDVPAELRHAVFRVLDRGWCVWGTTSADEIVTPAERDFYPLEAALPDRWSPVGWNGVRLHPAAGA
ncbi:hypothetical protein [Marinitenerispora sediminis]|uniref:hypothetical protein n=1 Tax=Marinitenerispora sediminis TaxID=1931232 RepID=UPI001F2EE747|nr:hypothetical protein [Marinitenerispora sediminis]